jgi:hypothetical protein
MVTQKQKDYWESLKGKKRPVFTESWRKKMSDSKKGKKPNNFGKPRSLSAKMRSGQAHIGEKNHNWKGGISKINKSERQLAMYSIEYKLWRKSVFERDNYTCIWCGVWGGKLNADHIKPWKDYPELRFAIDNGRTLCESCHRKTETYGRPKKTEQK